MELALNLPRLEYTGDHRHSLDRGNTLYVLPMTEIGIELTYAPTDDNVQLIFVDAFNICETGTFKIWYKTGQPRSS